MDDDKYFLYENRLASFHNSQRRQSNAKTTKVLSWPHKFLRPEDLARAGFVFNPAPTSPDNVECFLCHKSLDGWVEGDNPAFEHLKHAPSCGWAVVAAIEAGVGDLEKVDPRDSRMVEARKATFAGKWPHEKRKGWKCKTKQLVDAGWKYTPTLDSDDNTTCTYCELALDGWESGDKPLDEHSRRAPDCPFFLLINSNPAPPKKASKRKTARGSHASRLSIQSLATAVSDLTSAPDMLADVDDSVLTMTSVMTQGKKTTKGRKAAAPKARGKPRAKKDEAVEVLEDAPTQDEDVPLSSPPKAARGKKRGSDAMEESVITNAEAPAPKKRATRARNTRADEDELSVIEPVAPVRKASGRKKARTSTATTKSTRKGSGASIMSTASTASLRGNVPDDDELDRQLQADLDRPLTDDEDMVMDSDSERRKGAARQSKIKKGAKAVAQKQGDTASDFAIFDPLPPQDDDAAIEAELQAMQTEMEVDEENKSMPLPKKGRKAGPRKVSKQTKSKKGEQAEQEAVPVPSQLPDEESQEGKIEADMSVSSTATVLKNNPAKRGRGRPPKKSKEAEAGEDNSAGVAKAPGDAEAENTDAVQDKTVAPPAPRTANPITRKPVASALTGNPGLSPATPGANNISPAPSAKQPALSPSQSLQSSDAENQPPSSKPGNSVSSKRLALATLPVVSTPRRNGSPSRRNVIAGLQSTTPWAAADLDLVFCGSPGGSGNAAADDKENGVGRLLRKGAELTSPEKSMTVEDWIYHNAGLAEQMLKGECEAMVSAFEKEGGRAMLVLEGLVID